MGRVMVLTIAVTAAVCTPLPPALSASSAGTSGPGVPVAAAPSDFNGDGFSDAAMGANLEDLGAIRDAGVVHVTYGTAGALQAKAPDDQLWSQDSPDVEGVAEEFDEFGVSLTAGDFNGDHYADLAVASRREDAGGVLDAGAVNVLYGSASGLQATSPADQIWSQDSPSVKDDPEESDGLGFGLSAGDFNNDSYDDLAIGVQRENLDSLVDAGAANVLYGSGAGLQATSPDDQFWNQDSPDV